MTAQISLLGLVFALTLTSCGNPDPARRDLVLVLQERSPAAGASLLFDQLAQRALRFEGPLRHADSPLSTPSGVGLRVELFTGRLDPNHQDSVWPELPSLPEAARLSGRRAFGFTSPGGVTLEAGFGGFVAPSKPGDLGLFQSPPEQLDAFEMAFEKMLAEYERSGIERARLLVFFDLGSAASDQDLDHLLARLESLGISPDADLALFFTDPDSPTRLLLAGPSIPSGQRTGGVDPRDLFPTLARLARIPNPGVLQGRGLLDRPR